MQSSSVLSVGVSPSLSSYSSGRLADIAARVVEEFRAESGPEIAEMFDFNEEEEEIYTNTAHEQEEVKKDVEEEDEADDDFEFAFVCREPNSSPISADEIFHNGLIRPVFPLFNRDLLLGDVQIEDWNPPKPPMTPSPIRLPLRELFNEERDCQSCSSSDADELDGIASGTYCVWKPKSAEDQSLERCKKSNSSGSSKRWKFRDLLHRSNSDGKDTFIFLTPSNANRKKGEEKVEKVGKGSKVTGNAKIQGVSCGGECVSSATAAHFARNRAMKEDDRRRSLVPYKQDLVGFFANVNGLGRNLHPF